MLVRFSPTRIGPYAEIIQMNTKPRTPERPLMHRLLILVVLFCMVTVGRAEQSAATPAAKPNVGSLTGRFEYDGEIPMARRLAIPEFRTSKTGERYQLAEDMHYSKLGLQDESLSVGTRHGIKNIFVWIRDKQMPVPPVPSSLESPPIILSFKAGKLSPHAVTWWAPSRPLRLCNDSETVLNLRWDAHRGSPFNLTLPPQHSVVQNVTVGESLPSMVKSDILHWMSPTIILPCEHPYCTVTDEEGRFTLSDVPVGNWEIAVWHERCGWVKTAAWPKGRFKQSIPGSNVDLGTIKLSPQMFQLPDHPNQPHLADHPHLFSNGKPPEKVPVKTSWKIDGDRRRKANIRGEVQEFAGDYRLVLPAGFEYALQLRETNEGFMEFQCRTKITLLGQFAMNQEHQLLLISTQEEGVDDFIWTLNNKGDFVLTHEDHRVGATYQGAILTKSPRLPTDPLKYP